MNYLLNILSCDGFLLFLQIFKTDLDEMVEDLEQGDAAETVRVFFEQSRACPPQTKSTLSIQEVSCIIFTSFLGPFINVRKEGVTLTQVGGRGLGPIRKPTSKFGTHVHFKSAVPKIPASVRE